MGLTIGQGPAFDRRHLPDDDLPDAPAAKLPKDVSGHQRGAAGLIGVVLALLPTGTPMGFVAILDIIALSGMISLFVGDYVRWFVEHYLCFFRLGRLWRSTSDRSRSFRRGSGQAASRSTKPWKCL
jgi:hypothetical protein